MGYVVGFHYILFFNIKSMFFYSLSEIRFCGFWNVGTAQTIFLSDITYLRDKMRVDWTIEGRTRAAHTFR